MVLVGCKENNKEMEAFTKLEDAQNYVTESFDEKEETLMISDELNDAMGMNMAIIVDGILKKGYVPNGFEQKENYRVYKYQKD
jgi:hypothetical protein